ncbi:Cof-type HAD-IIB family hydrolase [Clostridium sp. MCC353]|uniref:HAD family hydrolase n=1 Tax=Clostridium sp. MCC353 TaxID=2592646 RepID=UPI001C034483|nr:HAD family hydrolase [Clostridium sp. MCC353]MBT9777260.1 Cof-type HAD-IIB family hydrolase [Clostridium sp. MCC353]
MIKLIVSDIDGTLLEDGGNVINPEVFDTILKLRGQGIQFAAASGRQWASIEQVFYPVKEKIFYLSDNGAYIGCHGRNLFLNTLDRQIVLDMVRDIREREDLEVMVSGPDVVYMETKDRDFVDWMVNGYKFRVKTVEDLTKVEDQFIKVAVYKKEAVEAATADLREKYKDKLKMTISGDMWMDCMANGINKGEAVKLLQESLEILPEETMAFGDQLNDIEMLKRAYYSFAIGNARPEVKKAARFQADTNVNDGVLKILKLLVTEK